MAKKILYFLATVCVFWFMLWAVVQYLELPMVKFSVSQQRVIAVENSKGEALPLSPLPDKYLRVYVE